MGSWPTCVSPCAQLSRSVLPVLTRILRLPPPAPSPPPSSPHPVTATSGKLRWGCAGLCSWRRARRGRGVAWHGAWHGAWHAVGTTRAGGSRRRHCLRPEANVCRPHVTLQAHAHAHARRPPAYTPACTGARTHARTHAVKRNNVFALLLPLPLFSRHCPMKWVLRGLVP